LFVERARLVLPAFKVTADNARAIAQVCSRLDGIPLALELAAARVKLLSVEQIADRLDDRFRLLTGGSRTSLPRQQTLQALIDWSWDLLNIQEAELLKRLAVFSGGWDLEAAEQVVPGEGIEQADVLDLLAQLVNKSLVTVGDETGPQRRYSLLETIRQYAGAKLQESGHAGDIRNKHLVHFSNLAGQAVIELHRRQQKKWLQRLDTEYDNLRTALEWAISTQPEEALRICTGLADYWDVRGYFNEGLAWATRTLKAAEAMHPSPTRVETMYGAAMLSARLTEVEQFQALTEKGLAMARQIEYRRGIARGLLGMVMITEYWKGNPEQVAELYADSLRMWREEGDKLGIGQALGPHAHRLYARQDYAGAERLFNESLALFRELEDQREIAGALENLAEVALAREDHLHARALAAESLALYRELEDKHGIATVLRTIGQAIVPPVDLEQLQALYEESCRLLREMNDRGCLVISLAAGARAFLAAGAIDRAQRMIREGMDLARETGEPEGTALLMEGAAELLQGLGRDTDSARLFGLTEAWRNSIPVLLSLCEQVSHDRAVACLRGSLEEADFAQAWAEGKTMSLEQAIELVKGD
jgi:tetratricopeptide (TPR) repeat protein